MTKIPEYILPHVCCRLCGETLIKTPESYWTCRHPNHGGLTPDADFESRISSIFAEIIKISPGFKLPTIHSIKSAVQKNKKNQKTLLT